MQKSNKEINDFAVRWLGRYRSLTTADYQVEEGFSDECFALGFEMDCGESFNAAFPETQAFQDAKSAE